MSRLLHRAAPAIFLALLAAALGVQAWHTDACARAMDQRFLCFGQTEDADMRFFTSPDAYAWLCHARDFLREPGWRKRWTYMDNAPFGRPLHWSQPPIWTLAGFSRLFRLAGRNEQKALELSGVCVMPLFAWLLAGTLGVWLGRKRGWTAAALFAALFLFSGAEPLREVFHPLAPDHHGMQLLSALACWAGLAFGRFGCSRGAAETRETRRCFAASGLWGAFACWLGASAWMWMWAVIAFSALAAMRFCGGNGGAGRRTDADAWRVWGLSAAAGILLFWAVEYAPHFEMRLEAIHPLHALAAAGFGEVMRFLSRLRRDWSAGETTRADRWLAAAGLAGALALPACVLVGPEAWFWPKTACMRMLHAHFIAEFLSPAAREAWWKDLPGTVRWLGLVPVWMLLLWAFERREPERTASAARWVLVLGAGALGCWMYRWQPFFCGALALAAADLAGCLRAERGWRRWTGAAALAALALGTGTDAVARWRAEERCASGAEPIAAWGNAAAEKRLVLAAAEAAGREGTGPVRWAGWLPAAPAVRYFTGAPSLGSYYWENRAGVEAECRFFADSPAGKDALAVAEARGLTHVACFRSPGPAFLYDSCRHASFDTRRAARSLGGELAKPEPETASWLVPDGEWDRSVAGGVLQGPDGKLTAYPARWKLVRLRPEEAVR